MCHECDIRLGFQHEVTLAGGAISEEGKAAILCAIADTTFPYSTPLPSDWKWTAKVSGKGEYVGSFAKRVAKYYHSIGIKLSSDLLGKIGSLVNEYTAKETQYLVDYTNKFDWEAGDFGDNGSCYWSCRSQAKDMIADNGGIAVRFYELSNRDKGIARAWLIPHDQLWVAFNAYGLQLSTIAQVVSSDLGVSYKKIYLENNGERCSTLWINSGSGYAIGNVDSIKYQQIIDLGIEDYSRNKQCCHCGDYFDSEDMTAANVGSVCNDCLEEYYAKCEECGEWALAESIKNIDDKYVCCDCINSHCKKCGDCGEYHYKENMTDVGPNDSYVYVCNECVEDHFYCEQCDDWIQGDDYKTIDNLVYCLYCAEERMPTCDCCGMKCEDTTTIAGQAVGGCCLHNYDYNDEYGIHVARGQLCLR